MTHNDTIVNMRKLIDYVSNLFRDSVEEYGMNERYMDAYFGHFDSFDEYQETNDYKNAIKDDLFLLSAYVALRTALDRDELMLIGFDKDTAKREISELKKMTEKCAKYRDKNELKELWDDAAERVDVLVEIK